MDKELALDEKKELWLASMTDPFREQLLAAGDELPDKTAACAEPVRDEPAFDPAMIDASAVDIRLPEGVGFPHPMLERVVRVGLAHIDATFQGNHPKYGVGNYADESHDTFPPTIISAVDALTLWDMTSRAQELFGHWLANFVRSDGTIDYYGPSLSEYGMLLTSARQITDRGGDAGWLEANRDALGRLAGHIRQLMRQDGSVALAAGVPEADERDLPATYFHNNAWMVRGLRDWADVLENRLGEKTQADQARRDAADLQAVLLEAIESTWPADADDWWLQPTLEDLTDPESGRPERITATRLGSYTNYRYWPELLSSGVLPENWMRRIVSARLIGGGQFCGVTRFEDWLDDWPLMDWLEGLWALGKHDDFRLCVWGHIYYHQAEGHLTAYEQVTFPPGKKKADYCLPCQLVAVRAARRLVG